MTAPEPTHRLEDPIMDIETITNLLTVVTVADEPNPDAITYLIDRLREHVAELRAAYEARLKALPALDPI
jgi:hypothetical protein